MTRSTLVSCVATVAIAASLALLPGCMKMNQSLVVSKDGSGTAQIKMVMDMAKVQEIMDMFGPMMGGEGGEGGDEMKKDIEEKTNLDEMKKQLEGKKGIELISATAIDDPEKKQKGFEAKLKFASLEVFFRAGLDMGHNIKLEDAGEGRWRLTRSMDMPGMDGGGEEEAAQAEMIKGMLEPMMGELEMGFSISIPGSIVETNGTKDEAGTSVTWKQSFATMLDSKASKQVVVFKPEAGLTLKAFDLKTDKDGAVSDAKPTTPSASDPVPAPAPAPEPAPVEPK